MHWCCTTHTPTARTSQIRQLSHALMWGNWLLQGEGIAPRCCALLCV